jgi:hypothetical protein
MLMQIEFTIEELDTLTLVLFLTYALGKFRGLSDEDAIRLSRNAERLRKRIELAREGKGLASVG